MATSSDSSPPGAGLLVNGRLRPLAAPITVQVLAEELALAGRRGVALAVNDIVVPRGDWHSRLLTAGDRVVVIQATRGG